MKKLLTLLVCLAIATGSAFAQKEQAAVQTGAKMSGYIFGDYFYKIGGDPTVSNALNTKGTQFSSNKKDDQAFNIRRMYLNFDYIFNEQFAGKVVIENNDKQFNSDSRFGFFLKYAYMEWKEIYPGAKLMIGIIPTSEWAGGLAEKGWTYRSVEKTLLDKSGLGTGVDLGVGLYGKFDKEGNYGYTAVVGNGTGTKIEDNKYKKYYLSLNAQPIKGLFAEVHYDFEPADKDLNKTTFKGVLFFQSADFTVGFEAMQRKQITVVDPETKITPFGFSGYAIYKINDNFKVFGRYDQMDFNTEITTSGYKEGFITAGVDFMPIKDIHIIPNIWMTNFSKNVDSAPDKDADLVARLTFFFNFK